MSTITVWTKPSCIQCEATKRTLTTANVPFSEKDLTDPSNQEALDAFKQRGLLQAPIVQSPTGTWSGFQPPKLQGAVNAHRTSTPAASTTMTGPALH